MNTQDSRLVMRDYPIFNWVIGIFFLGLGASYFPDLLKGTTSFNIVLVILEGILGILLIYWGSIVTIIADRITQTLTISSRSVFRGSQKDIPFADITAVELETSPSRRGSPTYRIVLVCRDGKSIPFHASYSSGTSSKMKQVEKLRAFLGVGGSDPATGLRGLMQIGSQMAQNQFQQQQESLTGSEVEDHLTDGVHWKVQTVTFGAAPVTRWFSPDFQVAGSFIYLTQKTENQHSSAGGLLAGLSNILYHESLAIYGFGAEDTPGAAKAEVLATVDAGLDPYFSAFTSDERAARQILNPGVVAQLADWATRYPLKNVQGRGVFGQLVVLFSPRGVYVVSLGTMIPEAIEELTNLGVAVIKAQ